MTLVHENVIYPESDDSDILSETPRSDWPVLACSRFPVAMGLHTRFLPLDIMEIT